MDAEKLPMKDENLGLVLEPVVEIGSTEHAHGSYKRTISPNQMHVISLGSNIGSGLFIATGKGLSNAGPLGAILAYGLVSSCVWAVLQVLGEMTIAFPTSGSFIDYADRFVNPSLAFAAGFAEWLGWCAVLGAEAVFVSIIINGWADNSVHEAVWITLFVLSTAILFSLPNKWFAWFEYFVSIQKIVALVLFLVLDFAIIFGAGPEGHFHDGQFWRDNPLFRNDFAGFSNSCLLALWAMSDQVFIGIMGGEASSPRLAISRAAKTVPVRFAGVYLLTLVFSILIDPSDARLFGGSAASQSPFTIAIQDAGIGGLDQFLNVTILVSCLGFGAESIYIASRILRAMSHQRLIPQWVAQVDSRGRPIWSLVATGIVSVALTYMNLSGTGSGIFNWLVSITSSAFFMVWGIIAISSFRFHAAVRRQNDPLFTQIFAWRAWCFPLPAVWLLVCSIFLLICCIYSGLFPLGSTDVSALNFFQYNLAVLIIVVFSVAHKIVARSRLRRSATADLHTDRRTLGEEEIAILRKYYGRPGWRRGISYFKLW